jgi:hypothetical protein
MPRLPPPRPWNRDRTPAPRVLGITLHRPWSEAFFFGGPGAWKDVENRKRFPMVPPGTLLALHTSATWDEQSEPFIHERLPGIASHFATCMPGLLVGVVRVQEVSKGDLFLPRKSRWYMGWGVGVWLAEERWRLATPIPFAQGWFGAWELPAWAESAVLEALAATPPLGATP